MNFLPYVQPFGRRVSSSTLNQHHQDIFKDLATIQSDLDTLETELEMHRLLSAVEHQSIYAKMHTPQEEDGKLFGTIEHMRIPDVEDPEDPPLVAAIHPLYRYASIPFSTEPLNRVSYIHPQTKEPTWDSSNTITVTPEKERFEIETDPTLGVVGGFTSWYARIRRLNQQDINPMEITYHIDTSSSYASNYDSNRFTFHPYPLGCTVESLEIYGDGQWKDVSLQPNQLGNMQLLLPMQSIEQVKATLSTSVEVPLGQELVHAVGVRHMNWEKVYYEEGVHHLYFSIPLPDYALQITDVHIKCLNEEYLPEGLISLDYEVWDDEAKVGESSSLPYTINGEFLVVDVSLMASQSEGIAPQIYGVEVEYTNVI